MIKELDDNIEHAENIDATVQASIQLLHIQYLEVQKEMLAASAFLETSNWASHSRSSQPQQDRLFLSKNSTFIHLEKE